MRLLLVYYLLPWISLGQPYLTKTSKVEIYWPTVEDKKSISFFSEERSCVKTRTQKKVLPPTTWPSRNLWTQYEIYLEGKGYRTYHWCTRTLSSNPNKKWYSERRLDLRQEKAASNWPRSSRKVPFHIKPMIWPSVTVVLCLILSLYGPVIDVETSIYIQAINNIKQSDFSYELTMNFR